MVIPMNDALCNELRDHLKDEFNLSFDVTYINNGPNFKLTIVPSTNVNQYFTIVATLDAEWKFSVLAKPSDYARRSIEKMGKAPEKCKVLCAQYCMALKKKGYNIRFAINSLSQDATDWHTWPQNWANYSVVISKVQVEVIRHIQQCLFESISGLVGMLVSLIDQSHCDNVLEPQMEGETHKVETTKYERNPLNRSLCLIANGHKCKICGFDFEERYGSIGRDFIEVHHIVPVSSMGYPKIIDPVADLIPVCPNCHAMLHRKDPPYFPDDIKKMIKEAKGK